MDRRQEFVSGKKRRSWRALLPRIKSCQSLDRIMKKCSSSVFFLDNNLVAEGSGASKQEAEQKAAKEGLKAKKLADEIKGFGA